MTSRSFWIGVVASVVVLVLAVGGGVLVASWRGNDVALPAEIGGLVAVDSDAAFSDEADLDDERRAEVIASRRDAQEYGAAKVSDAFDGSDASVRSYADAEALDTLYTVTAIADDAGPLIPENAFDDPEFLGYALPMVDRVTEGEVSCLVRRTQPPLAEREYDDEDAAFDSMLCQRSSGSLTVRVAVASGDVDATVDLVDDVWDEVG